LVLDKKTHVLLNFFLLLYGCEAKKKLRANNLTRLIVVLTFNSKTKTQFSALHSSNEKEIPTCVEDEK